MFTLIFREVGLLLRRYSGYFGITIVITLVCFLGAEIIFRLNYFGTDGLNFIRVTPASMSQALSDVKYSATTVTGFGPGPFCYRGGCSTINSHGFRGREFQLKKLSGTFRVVILGSSIGAGPALTDSQLYSTQLEELLKNSSKRKKFEVLSLAIPGAHLGNLIALYEKFVPQLDPDLVLIESTPAIFFRNGNTENLWPIGLRRKEPFLGSWLELLFDKKYMFFRSQFFMIGFFDERINKVKSESFDESEQDIFVNSFEQTLGKFNKIKSSVPTFIVLLRPPRASSLKELRTKLSKVVFGKGLGLIDTFDSQYPQPGNIFPGDWHPNSKFHSIYARTIHSFLLRHIDAWPESAN